MIARVSKVRTEEDADKEEVVVGEVFTGGQLLRFFGLELVLGELRARAHKR